MIKLLLLVFLFITLNADKPKLLLLNKYTQDINTTSWYMSEKLDGFRAFWDGEKLISRSGKVFKTPPFFIENFPNHKLDGELWRKREDFSNLISIINTKKSYKRWDEITFNIFEVPDAKGTLIQRLSQVVETKYIKKIKQIRVKNKQHLYDFLKSVEKKGGEGIVVRDGSVDYYTGRSNKALKVKSHIDSECEVIGYNEGKGKYTGLLGSLSCRMKNLKVIKIGSGFSKMQRTYPVEIGTIITFKYYGLTTKGNPRFPIFLRTKDEDK